CCQIIGQSRRLVYVNLPFETNLLALTELSVDVTFSQKIISTSLLEYFKTERSFEKVFVFDAQNKGMIEGTFVMAQEERAKKRETEQEMGIFWLS
ncbi:uncharacterized protein Bfra_010074, partial [Botrytis fragariae]